MAMAGTAAGIDDAVADGLQELRGFEAAPFQDVAGELAIMRALFDQPEDGGASEVLPHLVELPGEQAPEKRPGADTGVEIAQGADG